MTTENTNAPALSAAQLDELERGTLDPGALYADGVDVVDFRLLLAMARRTLAAEAKIALAVRRVADGRRDAQPHNNGPNGTFNLMLRVLCEIERALAPLPPEEPAR